MGRVFQVVLNVFFGINLTALLLSAASPYINPKIFWPPALFGLFFKVFLLVNLGMLVIYILLNNRRMIVASLCATLLCLPGLSNSYGMWPRSEPAEAGKRIKLMTYNIQSFGWFEDSAALRNMFENIKRERPDILCLQEYCIHPPKHKRILRHFRRTEGYPYYYEYVVSKIAGNNRVGLAVFSRFPFKHITPIPFNNTSNGAFAMDVGIGKDTLRLFNVHFQSIGLRERDLKLPSNLVNGEDPQAMGRFRVSLKKFMGAFRKRSVQAELVKKEIDSSRYPVIVCGDFNDSPISFLYSQMTERLSDTWLQTNRGLGSTFAGRIPWQRIDYILADPFFRIEKTRVIRRPGSDHYPLVCTFSFPSEKVK